LLKETPFQAVSGFLGFKNQYLSGRFRLRCASTRQVRGWASYRVAFIFALL
jgi:hypothetical protein